MCNILPPPSEATFPSLAVCLHLLDSRDRHWCLRQASKHNFGLLWPWLLTFWSPRSTVRHGLGVHSYADDTQLYFHTAPAMVDNKVQRLVVCVEKIRQWMNANWLKLNEDKTQFIWLGTPHQLSEVQCQKISLRGVDIQISTEVTCLGVLLDSKLFAPHTRRLSGKCFYHIRQLKTVRRSLTEDVAKSLVHAFVTGRIDCCNSVIYGAHAAYIQPLQNVLNGAARLILHKRKYDHITSDIRDRLHWLPIQQRLEYKICLLLFKCLHQTAPVYLTVMSDQVFASASRSHLRSAALGDLAVPRSRTMTYGQRSFFVFGPSLWNSLPLSVRDQSLTMTQFCTHLKTFLFRRAYRT